MKRLKERAIARDRWSEKRRKWPTVTEHLRAEYALIRRRICQHKKKLERARYTFRLSNDPRDFILYERCDASVQIINDVLALLKELSR